MANGARGSFQQRARVSLLMPDAFAHPVAKIFGYLWRLGVLALLGGVVYWVMLRSHLGSAEFSRHMAREAQALLQAESVKLPPLSWRGDKASVRQFSATGGDGAFFRTLEAENVGFRVPLAMLWGKEWKLRRLEASAIKVELRSGGLAGAAEGERGEPGGPHPFGAPDVSAPEIELNLEGPSSKETMEDIRLLKDGMGVAPRLQELSVSSIDASRFHAGWGITSATRGELKDGQGFAMSREDGGHWLIELASGEWSQNWLKGLRLSKLRALCASEAVDFEETQVRLGEGTGTLHGRVLLGQTPTLDLTLKMQDFPLSSFLPEPCDKFLSLRAGGELKLGGSPNRASGITVSGRLVPASGAIMGLPIQQSLAVATGRVRFREWEITGGTVTLATGPGRCETAFDLHSREDIVLRGTLSSQQDQFSGQVKIGVDPALLQRMAPPVRARFFAEKAEGKEWMAVPLEGVMEQLTENTAKQLMAAHEQAGQQ